MAKKFFDIIPPKQIEVHPQKVRSKRTFPKRFVFFLCLFLLVLGMAVFVFIFFSKIKIDIWPEKESLDLEQKITIDPNLKETALDFWLENKVIPGKVFQDERSASQEFTASGKSVKEEKSKGKIRVYNNYSTSPRTLVPSRFVSSEGKLFWSVEKTIIPGGRYEKGKLIPGEVDVDVVAAEPGEDYNIGPSTFALPALAGTPLYTAVYGKSSSAMTGGFKGEVHQVSKEDLDKAETILTDKLKKESKDFFQTSLSNDYDLLEETLSQEVIEKKSSVGALALAESFGYSIKLKSQIIGFNKADIENFVRNFVISTVPEGKKLQEESLEINYSLDSAVSNSLNLKIKGKIYSDINISELKRALVGKSRSEGKIFLENLPQLSNVKIKFWPFWQRKISENIEKLEIIIRLD